MWPPKLHHLLQFLTSLILVTHSLVQVSSKAVDFKDNSVDFEDLSDDEFDVLQSEDELRRLVHLVTPLMHVFNQISIPGRKRFLLSAVNDTGSSRSGRRRRKALRRPQSAQFKKKVEDYAYSDEEIGDVDYVADYDTKYEKKRNRNRIQGYGADGYLEIDYGTKYKTIRIPDGYRKQYDDLATSDGDSGGSSGRPECNDFGNSNSGSSFGAGIGGNGGSNGAGFRGANGGGGGGGGLGARGGGSTSSSSGGN